MFAPAPTNPASQLAVGRERHGFHAPSSSASGIHRAAGQRACRLRSLNTCQWRAASYSRTGRSNTTGEQPAVGRKHHRTGDARRQNDPGFAADGFPHAGLAVEIGGHVRQAIGRERHRVFPVERAARAALAVVGADGALVRAGPRIRPGRRVGKRRVGRRGDRLTAPGSAQRRSGSRRRSATRRNRKDFHNTGSKA